jgi:putative PIN family toxin of toxin-antitoxin system
MPQHVSLRLVVDHNVWISYLLTRSFRRLDQIMDSEHVRILFTDDLLDDLASVLERPKLAKHLDPADVGLLFQRISGQGERINVKSVVHICRDPDDDSLLALSKDGSADILITGDEDLLVLKKFGKTRIQSPAEFLRNHP